MTMRTVKKIAAAVFFCAAALQGAAMAETENLDKLIVAHRGASGYLPEHTLEAKALAYAMGVPYLEQDLAMTKDGRLIVIHDHYLDRVTDVADKFPGRAREDGRYYAIDFTLDEIKSLNFTEGFNIDENGNRVQGYPGRFPMFTSTFKIHTFEEEIEFIQGMNKTMGREVGLYVETKAPWLHKQHGMDISKATLEVLKKYGYTSKDSPVYFQTFDWPDLKYVKDELMPALGMDLKTVILVTSSPDETYELKDGKWQRFDYHYLIDPKNFAELAKYADGVGPDYHMLIDEQNSRPGSIKVNDLVQQYHQHGLQVHPYTIRKDQLPTYAADVDEIFDAVLYQAGADGVFTDFPDLGIAFVKAKEQQ